MMEKFHAEIGAKIKDFQRKMQQVDKIVRKTAMEANKPIGANIKEFQMKMAEIQAESKLVLKRDEKTISADISDFMRKAVQVAVVARTLSQSKIVIPVELRIKKFQAAISRIATNVRSFGELTSTTFRGIGIALAPTLVPLIASLGGLVGQLGPMLGVVAGSTFALASAFAVAGIGAVAFGGLAMTNLKGVFDESKKAKTAMDNLKQTWADIAKSTKAKTVESFTKVLNILHDALHVITPMFTSVTDAVGRLVDSLGASFKSESMTAFFNYLNKSAGPMLETVTKGIGNFVLGILNMITAFAPLTEATAKGFEAMGRSFADWAAGLSKSEKFQSFVDYVNENMPKIRSIFSDAFQGIINLFAGFGTSSSEMMTGLQNMMERFKEWSSTISANQGFQKFIDYIKENGPATVALIGNIVTTIVAIGVALAPMGAKLLEIINSFLQWTSTMMENHPILGKIGAAVLLITGALIAIAPNIIAFRALFGGAATAIMAATSLMRAKFVLGMAMMIQSMVAAGIKMVVTTATFVAKWALIGAKALLGAAKSAAAWLLATGTAMATAVAGMIATTATFIAKWALIGAKSLLHAAKVAAAWLLSTGAAMATAVGSMIATSAVFVAKWVWMGAQALLQAARMAAAWFIALGPVGWVIGIVVALAILIIANWDKIKAATIRIWNKISDGVKDAWEKVKEKTGDAVDAVVGFIGDLPGKVTAFVADMKQAGADLISGVISGITGKIGEGLAAIGGFASGLLARFKKDTGTHSPSRYFANISKYFAPGIVRGIDKTSHLAVNSISGLATSLTDAFSPKLAMADMQANATLNTSINRADMKAVQHSFAADLGSLDIDQPDMIIVMDGKEVGKLTAKHVANENNRHDKMVKVTKGRR